MSKVRRPKFDDDKFIDFYFEQFSEVGDKPLKTVHFYGEGYYPVNAYDPGDQLKQMRSDAKWLLQCADYLQKEYSK